MTALERQLAETFRAARWADSDGRPVCPSCYDHRSVRADKKPRSGQPGLYTYFCMDCRTRWSDVSRTVLAKSTKTLRAWALALLMDKEMHDWRYVGAATGYLPEHIRSLWERWQLGSQLAPAWRKTLAEAGITWDILRQRDRPQASRKERTAC